MSKYFDENLPRTHEQFGKQAGYEKIEKPDDMHNNILEVLKRRVSFEWEFDHVRIGVNTEKKRYGSSEIDLVYIFERAKPAKKLSRREQDKQYNKAMMAINPFSPEAVKAEKEYKAFKKEIERGIPPKYFCLLAHHLYNHNYPPYPLDDRILYYYITLGDRKEAIDSLKFKGNEIDKQIEALTKPLSRSA